MFDKFSIEDLLIKVIPGGFLLGVIYLLFIDKVGFDFVDNLDFFYAFIFFCCAFILGELLQMIAHELEWFFDLFFKFYRPSEIFLYKHNPILKSDYKRSELFQKLAYSGHELDVFEKDYSEVALFFSRKKDRKNAQFAQSIFWELFSAVSENDGVKNANRTYLFVRVMTLEFLIIGGALLLRGDFYLGALSVLFCLMFFWRSRGVARNLVFKTVLIYLKGR